MTGVTVTDWACRAITATDRVFENETIVTFCGDAALFAWKDETKDKDDTRTRKLGSQNLAEISAVNLERNARPSVEILLQSKQAHMSLPPSHEVLWIILAKVWANSSVGAWSLMHWAHIRIFWHRSIFDLALQIHASFSKVRQVNSFTKQPIGNRPAYDQILFRFQYFGIFGQF